MNGKELEDEHGERGMGTNGWHFSTHSYLKFSQDPGLAACLQVFERLGPEVLFLVWLRPIVPHCEPVWNTMGGFNCLVHQNYGGQWAGRCHGDERRGRPMICAGYGEALEKRHIQTHLVRSDTLRWTVMSWWIVGLWVMKWKGRIGLGKQCRLTGTQHWTSPAVWD